MAKQAQNTFLAIALEHPKSPHDSAPSTDIATKAEIDQFSCRPSPIGSSWNDVRNTKSPSAMVFTPAGTVDEHPRPQKGIVTRHCLVVRQPKRSDNARSATKGAEASTGPRQTYCAGNPWMHVRRFPMARYIVGLVSFCSPCTCILRSTSRARKMAVLNLPDIEGAAVSFTRRKGTALYRCLWERGRVDSGTARVSEMEHSRATP